ncbi:hypothetical protein GGR51DRAFT_540027 [Nemania sp. FL0031]|nr:hypothetical protein GGR51DRAFT_540027 [Nemania sp. FL0031]
MSYRRIGITISLCFTAICPLLWYGNPSPFGEPYSASLYILIVAQHFVPLSVRSISNFLDVGLEGNGRKAARSGMKSMSLGLSAG